MFVLEYLLWTTRKLESPHTKQCQLKIFSLLTQDQNHLHTLREKSCLKVHPTIKLHHFFHFYHHFEKYSHLHQI
ncbi:hypothetical protein Metme_3871 [Methylomonas methanica MC09]|uniref:Uncharacterized protein n=1 Tax=Methylomonas methanica (strain DSM 25384 / MC09) TaxID=857087 RepID=F9ZXS0_METMM|nr:hypothetical protein Metme_3871 [Methylomonas methanica MC09]